jgi:aspartate aminotransferase-like enzyme
VILLNPGPVTLSPRVRRALAGGEDLCHREPEFYALTSEVLRSLEAVHDAAGYRAVMLTGSGTCAVEAMLSTFALRDRATLVVANGVYGERMAEMLARARGSRRAPCGRRGLRPSILMRWSAPWTAASRVWRWSITRRPPAG